jgi:hypothetical protein
VVMDVENTVCNRIIGTICLRRDALWVFFGVMFVNFGKQDQFPTIFFIFFLSR